MPEQYVRVDVEEFWKNESLTFQNWDISDYRLTDAVKEKLVEINKKLDDKFDVGYTDLRWNKDLTDEQIQSIMPEIEQMVNDLNAQISTLSSQYYDTSKGNKEEIVAQVNTILNINLPLSEEGNQQDVIASDLKETFWDLALARKQVIASNEKKALE